LPRKRNQIFTPGESNKIIDALLHPLAKQDMGFWALDLFFHAVVEQNPRVTVEKFMRFDLPKIVEQYLKQSNGRKRRRY